MRVAIASSGLGHVARGIEAWASDLAAELDRRGVDVRLCKGAGPAAAPYERVVPCVRRDSRLGRLASTRLATRILWRFGWGGGYAVEQSTFARGLLRLLADEDVDLLHVQDPLLALLVQEARGRGAVKTRAILGHGTEEPNEFLARLDYVQHLAPWRLEQAQREGCHRASWTAIPNFIDTERFAPDGPNLRDELGLAESTRVVLCVAAIKRGHKRIDYLLDEFAAVADGREACLIVAGGRESDTDELMKIGTQRLGERVRFLPALPREKMPELYRTADVFTLTSLNEMMPIALIEAAASGLPCVTHEHPVMQWMTGPGGVVADLRAPGGLAAPLGRLLDDPAEAERQGRAARTHAVASFSTERVVDRIVEYYRQVLDDAVPSASREVA
ncbi:glycosyltransferase family 4 protein [Botrimarina mediterranea]|uniref:glycosyltransferase family 4 protein n=1 Tax=Botrimarina mediterranea TaxID=2528022 RepID=UPI00118B847A|nr:Alpha-galactosylglucosyldiacylglycerol synthase [Planctomycetes bacterium K2D]